MTSSTVSEIGVVKSGFANCTLHKQSVHIVQVLETQLHFSQNMFIRSNNTTVN